MSTCPFNESLLAVVGDGVFREYRYHRQQLKLVTLQKVDFPHITSHAWLSDDHIVAGTVDGRLILYSSGEYRMEYPINKQYRSSLYESADVEMSAISLISKLVLLLLGELKVKRHPNLAVFQYILRTLLA